MGLAITLCGTYFLLILVTCLKAVASFFLQIAHMDQLLKKFQKLVISLIISVELAL